MNRTQALRMAKANQERKASVIVNRARWLHVWVCFHPSGEAMPNGWLPTQQEIDSVEFVRQMTPLSLRAQ